MFLILTLSVTPNSSLYHFVNSSEYPNNSLLQSYPSLRSKLKTLSETSTSSGIFNEVNT